MTVASAQGKITVERRFVGYMDRLRAYRVMVDGQEIGRVKNGETATYDVTPGQHQVQLGIDWARSPSLTVNVGPGEEIRLLAAPKANPFTALYYITFGRNQYIDLRQA